MKNNNRTNKMIRELSVFCKKVLLIFTALSLSATICNAYGSEEPEGNPSEIFTDAFKVNVLLQSGLRYSLNDDDFQGGRTFQVPNARIALSGMVDNGFFYRVMVNVASEPNLLDAYVGYSQSDAFRIKAGAMKPQQTQDFIRYPIERDFVDVTRITGQLVQSWEIGVSAEGDIDGFYYFGGIFNGTRLSDNNNNSFYGIARLQYTIDDFSYGNLKVALQGSHGDSPGVRSGRDGPMLRGTRTIYGGDLRLEGDQYLFAAEYLAGDLEIVALPGEKEKISGYYLTGGYSLTESTMLLGRWQSWGYREADFRDNQVTFGVNTDLTKLSSLQFNFDTYLPDENDSRFGLSFIFQFMF